MHQKRREQMPLRFLLAEMPFLPFAVRWPCGSICRGKNFDEAAEYGTRKVMCDHATLALAVTTDGSISQIPRAEYEGPEQRIVEQLKALGKPFVLLLNSTHPEKSETKALAAELSGRYGVSVLPVSCADLNEADFIPVLSELLSAFPVQEIRINLPTWVRALPRGHAVKTTIYGALKQAVGGFQTMRDLTEHPTIDCPQIESLTLIERQYGEGRAAFRLQLPEGLFYQVLSQSTGLNLENEGDLLCKITEMAEVCRAYEKLRPALEELEATGYGIVTPDIASLSLEEPEIVQQNGKFGVRLRASAPSIHLMRAQIETEISPIVGSERQSEELVNLLMESFREAPISIWQSNIFGTSLHELVNEGLHQKLYRMPTDARAKLQETIERIINEGCGGLVCIIL